ncbi:hypothetical protein SGRI78S_00097 [Streptomyces griseus subsp. griseus]
MYRDLRGGMLPPVGARRGGVERTELDQPYAAGELGSGLRGGRERQLRLAHPARTDERDQPVFAQQFPELAERLGPADQAGEGGWQVRGRAGRGSVIFGGGSQRRVLGEDRLVQGRQLGAGVQTQVFGQVSTQVGVAAEGRALPAGTVERPHMSGAQPFPEGVQVHHITEFVGHQRVFTEVQPGLGLLLQRGQPLLLQPVPRWPGELFVGEVGEGGPPPQRQRVCQQGGAHPGVLGRPRPCHQVAEPVRVHRVGARPQLVSRRVGHHEVPAARLRVLKRPPQLPHLVLERACRVVGRPRGP